MSVTRDGDTGRWMSQLRITDWTGKTVHKKKRGFATKREAVQWEQEFISQSTGNVGMKFGSFVEIYNEDMKQRLKETTLSSKKWLIDTKILPYFRKIPLNEIKPTDIRKWQNSLTKYRDEDGKPYSQTYLRTIQNQLVAIFNYAVKYYGLKENPCHKAGGMGKKQADEMLFWTQDEFQKFIESVEDEPVWYAIYMTLYYTGIREGELLALTPADIDLEKKMLTVNKNYQYLNGKEIITTPKTQKSIRTISMPDKLCECLEEYMGLCYGLKKDDRIFPYKKEFLYKIMEEGCRRSGVKKIRVHDTRHSHASLLVEKGFSPAADRGTAGPRKGSDHHGHLQPPVSQQAAGSSQNTERDDRPEKLGQCWLQKKRKNVANL